MIGDSEVCPGPVVGTGDGIGIDFNGAGDIAFGGTGTGGCESISDGTTPFVWVRTCPCMPDPDSDSRTGGGATPLGGGRGVVVNGPVPFTPVPEVGAGVPPLPIPLAPPLFGLPLPLPRPPLPPSFSPLILSFKNLTI